jgi:hypothetical protein
MQATLTEYEGDRDSAGLCHVQGRAVFTSGQVFQGQWQNGHMQGDGSVQFPDGISYTGSFEADAVSGSGVSTLQLCRFYRCHIQVSRQPVKRL